MLLPEFPVYSAITREFIWDYNLLHLIMFFGCGCTLSMLDFTFSLNKELTLQKSITCCFPFPCEVLCSLSLPCVLKFTHHLWIIRQWYRDSAELREEWRKEYLEAWNLYGLTIKHEAHPPCPTCSIRSLRTWCPWPASLTRQSRAPELHCTGPQGHCYKQINGFWVVLVVLNIIKYQCYLQQTALCMYMANDRYVVTRWIIAAYNCTFGTCMVSNGFLVILLVKH